VLLIQMGIGRRLARIGAPASSMCWRKIFPLEKALLWYGEAIPLYCRSAGRGARGGGHLDALISGAALPSLLRRCRRQFDTLVIDGAGPSKRRPPCARWPSSPTPF